MVDYSQLSDEELILRLRDGESEITDYLMEKYKGFVRRRSRAMYLIGGDTDDLIQEGMIGLFKAVQGYDTTGKASFKTFAGLCVDRQMYTAIQSSRRQKHIPLNSYVPLDGEGDSDTFFVSRSENPEDMIIDRESTQDLQNEIRKTLSPMENKVLEYYLEGYGYVKIAEIMEKPPKSIDNALNRIRTKIKNCPLPFSNKK